MLADLRLVLGIGTVTDSSIAIEYLNTPCASVCRGDCYGPGQHSCTSFIQLTDPYTQTSRVVHSGDSNLFDDREITSNEVSLTLWFNADNLTGSMTNNNFLLQMIVKAVNKRDLTELSYVMENRIALQLTVEEKDHVHTDGSFSINNYGFTIGSISYLYEHFNYDSVGLHFVSLSISLAERIIRICNFINGQQFCKSGSIGENFTSWRKVSFEVTSSIILGLEGVYPSAVLDVRFYYTKALSTTEVESIYNEKLTHCKIGCELCKNAILCLRCQIGYYLDTTSGSGDCIQCPSTCPECTGVPEVCGTCLYIHESLCVSQCSDGTYNLGRTCLNCDLTCRTCDGPSSTDCLSCFASYFKYDSITNECIPYQDCLSNQYASSVCVDCMPHCNSCINGDSCNKCSDNYFFDSATGICTTTCPKGYWKDITQARCKVCHDYCVECRGPSNTDLCSNCYEPAYWMTNRRTCYLECTNGEYYKDVTRTCEYCHELCSICTGPGNVGECSSCRNSGFKQPNGPDCLTTCPDRYYGYMYQCIDCPVICELCVGSNPLTDCSKCKPQLNGKMIYQIQTLIGCVYECDPGFWESDDKKLCMPCHSRCAVCEGPNEDSQCKVCRADGFKQPDNLACLTTCPDHYYGSLATNSCLNCHEWCSVCSGPTTFDCTSCQGPAFLSPTRSSCSLTCTDGYWGNLEVNNCDRCHPNCLVCDGPNTDSNCSDCKNGSLKQPGRNSCLFNCPDGYWEDFVNGICSECHSYCKICSGPGYDACKECSSLAFLQPSSQSCKATCPTGYLRNVKMRDCEACGASCYDCSTVGLVTECLKCKDGLLIQPETHFCGDGCPSGNFADESGFCLPCDPACKACFGRGPDQCTECNEGFAIQPQSTACKKECPDLYWMQGTQCLQCHGACLDCEYATDCIDESCDCLGYCSNAYYIDCVRCQSCLAVRCGLCITVTLTAETAASYLLSFSKMPITEIKSSDFSLTVDQEPIPFTVHRVGNSFTITTTAKAASGSLVSVRFYSPTSIIDESGLGLKKAEVQTTAYSEPEPTSYKATYTSSAQAASTVITLSGLMNMKFKLVWIIMNVVQLVSFVPLGYPNLPQDLKDLLGSIDTSSSIPNILAFIGVPKDSKSPPSFVKDYGYDSVDFIHNSGPFFTILFAYLTGWSIAHISSRLFSIKRLQFPLSFNAFFRLFIQSYMKLSVAAFIQVMYGEHKVSLMLGYLFIVKSTQVFHVFLALLFGLLLWNSNSLILAGQHGNLVTFSVLFKEFKNDQGLGSVFYYPIFCFRRLLHTLCLVGLASHPILQCAAQIIIAVTVKPT